MGDLLRRYWMPIAGTSAFDKNPIKAVRLMGEDLVLYRDLSGNYKVSKWPRRPSRRCCAVRSDCLHSIVKLSKKSA
jgi:5,5'-dehydrodivanillate O-demethylase